ncbi:hypothetical protein HID58_034084, partial [Brassica napus]
MSMKVWKDQEKIFEDFYNKTDAIYYPLNNSVAWRRKTMEKVQLKVDYHHEIIHRHQEYITKGKEATKSFVCTLFEMSKED